MRLRIPRWGWRLFAALGLLITMFLVIDIAMVFWYAIRAGGTVMVGDELWVLEIELFILVPLSLVWMLLLLVRRHGP